MERNNSRKILRLENGRSRPVEREVVQEFPLTLFVNGRELPTLIASPHQLNFVVAGFLRLQGFVETLDDLLTLGICADDGCANVQIKGEVPKQLRPTLTSGCGTGITFNLPVDRRQGGRGRPRNQPPFSSEAVLGRMKELARLAGKYRRHGGIHSAAVGDGQGILLYAEDIGRHNTLDRIAGEALFKGLDLQGKMLVTSGRVSSEMVAKATRLGIALIASRTSPTDIAVEMSEEAGITLVGYARGDSFEIFSHAERVVPAPEAEKIPNVTGVILAGGESQRMGSNKALLPHRGGRFIETVYRQLAPIFPEVIVVTNNPELYRFLPCRKVPDLFPGGGSLVGIHSGLYHSTTSHIFAVACDMPHLHGALIGHIAAEAEGADVVIPESPRGLEPLHALYGRNCLPAVEDALRSGKKKIISFFDRVRVKQVASTEVAEFAPDFSSFRNINTPEEYFDLRDGEKESLTEKEEEKSRSRVPRSPALERSTT